MTPLIQLSVMKTRGLLVAMLFSGYVLVCGVQPTLRRFHSVPLMKTWAEAQRHCRETFTDIATIQDLDQDTAARQAAGSGQFWIGLQRDMSWKWSEDASMDTKFTSWSFGEPKSGRCVTTSGLGLWAARDCAAQHYFLCYNAAAQLHVLVKQLRNWTEAQTFCRTEYSHLSSIRTVEENFNTASLVGSRAGLILSPPVWIGLSRQTWVWSDRSNASYRRWALQQPDGSADCALMDARAAQWDSRPCEEPHAFLCHTDGPSITAPSGRPAAVRVVKVRLSGSPAELSDTSVQDSILLQLRQRLEERGVSEGVELRWKQQPDGNVFHTEEESTPPADMEEKDGCMN